MRGSSGNDFNWTTNRFTILVITNNGFDNISECSLILNVLSSLEEFSSVLSEVLSSDAFFERCFFWVYYLGLNCKLLNSLHMVTADQTDVDGALFGEFHGL